MSSIYGGSMSSSRKRKECFIVSFNCEVRARSYPRLNYRVEREEDQPQQTLPHASGIWWALLTDKVRGECLPNSGH